VYYYEILYRNGIDTAIRIWSLNNEPYQRRINEILAKAQSYKNMLIRLRLNTQIDKI
jgi:hypothetical protein